VNQPPLPRRLLAEFLGSLLLAALVIGSGIAAQKLSPGATGLELLENAAATAAGLFAIILMFGPVSGGHLNPVVSFADAALGGITWRDAAAYLPAQVAGCVAGAVTANLMFARAAVSISAKHRASPAHFLGEVVATAGLLLVIFALARTGRSQTAPAAVGAYIGAAYFFTSSTSFANPAITVGRMFSATFAGIAPSSAPAFVAAQVVGGAFGMVVIKLLYPRITPGDAAAAVGPHLPQDADHDGRPAQSPVTGPARLGALLMHLIAIGGSDAGISAALRARELDPQSDVTVVVADAYPNFSICGIPYYISGEVSHWRNLAHRTTADLQATGMNLRLDTTARRIDPGGRTLLVTGPDGGEELLGYDKLIIGTGAVPVVPPIGGLSGPDALGANDGVHLLHSMSDTFALRRTLTDSAPASAVIVGAGYIGLEMADALVTRGMSVTQMEQLPEVLPTVDPELGALVHAELTGHGAEVLTATTVTRISRAEPGSPAHLTVEATTAGGQAVTRSADVVLVAVGVRPDTDLAASAGAALGARHAIAVDRQMHTTVPGVFAAGDCVVTYHRLLGETYLPLGTTAHKQGRVAGENALGGTKEFAGSLGTQVVKVFELAAARTGLCDHEATAAGFDPVTIGSEADDHKAYYPGSHRIAMRYTGDKQTGRLLGVQLFGHRHAEVAKRIDIAATAIFHGMTIDAISDLDLSYTPPLGSPWDAIQVGAQAWDRQARPAVRRIF
jgi:NADPH-dependent 2,4-dienoyl-CoA reductase/sulfur reductase-like enzyme/glycerol uptake facilitator-like aquaporin